MTDECTHEVTEWGLCVGCGAEIESEYGYRAHPARITGCMGRGWYHDGSEQEDAIRKRRPARPCPHCMKETR